MKTFFYISEMEWQVEEQQLEDQQRECRDHHEAYSAEQENILTYIL